MASTELVRHAVLDVAVGAAAIGVYELFLR
jgi:hypothetical protein